MRERVVTFGEDKRLVGILCEPDTDQKVSSAPAIIFLNSGLLHHVGPSRLYVELARDISCHGFVSIRFDLGGLGDSLPAMQAKPDMEQILLDAKHAMDEAERKFNIKEYVLVGLCTGAANAHRIAVADVRVVGVCGLSGYAYPTLRFNVYRYGPILLNRKRLWQATVRAWKRFVPTPGKDAAAVNRENTGWWRLPPKDDFVFECKKLFERGVRIFAVFTGGDSYYLYENQLMDTLSSLHPGDKLQEKYNRTADHTYTSVKQRKLLVEQVRLWLTAGFGSSENV